MGPFILIVVIKYMKTRSRGAVLDKELIKKAVHATQDTHVV